MDHTDGGCLRLGGAGCQCVRGRLYACGGRPCCPGLVPLPDEGGQAGSTIGDTIIHGQGPFGLASRSTRLCPTLQQPAQAPLPSYLSDAKGHDHPGPDVVLIMVTCINEAAYSV